MLGGRLHIERRRSSRRCRHCWRYVSAVTSCLAWGISGFFLLFATYLRFAEHLLFVVIADLCDLQSAAWGTHLDSLQRWEELVVPFVSAHSTRSLFFFLSNCCFHCFQHNSTTVKKMIQGPEHCPSCYPITFFFFFLRVGIFLLFGLAALSQQHQLCLSISTDKQESRGEKSKSWSCHSGLQ